MKNTCFSLTNYNSSEAPFSTQRLIYTLQYGENIGFSLWAKWLQLVSLFQLSKPDVYNLAVPYVSWKHSFPTMVMWFVSLFQLSKDVCMLLVLERFVSYNQTNVVGVSIANFRVRNQFIFRFVLNNYLWFHNLTETLRQLTYSNRLSIVTIAFPRFFYFSDEFLHMFSN